MAEDKQMIVLGGLIDDSLVQNVQKVPVLGDIPLLGNLFRTTGTEKVKRNLLVFIQPTIVRDAATTNDITHGKYDFIRSKQIDSRNKGVFMLDDSTTPVLVPRDKAFTVPSFGESDIETEPTVTSDPATQAEASEDDGPVDSTDLDDYGF